MDLFGKKVSDEEWQASVSELVEPVRRICAVLETTGRAVAGDPISGWMAVAETLSSLGAYDEPFKAARTTFRRIGKPMARHATTSSARQSLDTFFTLGDLAIYWGKLHYNDASGGPGHRARTQTGMGHWAAHRRVMQNGTKFAENALAAANAGLAAIDALSSEPYRLPGPSLMEVFIYAVDDLRSYLPRQKKLGLAKVARIGGWCFSQAAILGMVVTASPAEFVKMVWNPTELETLWEMVEAEQHRIENEGLDPDASLIYIRSRTAYADLYGPDAFSAALSAGNLRKLERLADSPVSISDARMRWYIDTAVGLGLGIRRPDTVRACLEAQANPDPDSWAQAHQAGVDIPAEPDAMSVDEQIEGVLEVCRAYFEEYYPEAKQKLDALVP